MSQLRWIVAGLVFGISAGLLKIIFFPSPEYDPPAIYPAIIAFLISALLWRIIPRIENTILLTFYGGIAGAIVGWITPVLMWPVFLFILALSLNKFPELFFWSPVYMSLSLYQASQLTAILGFLLGVVLINFQRKAGSISKNP
jgi:hypothetical protein